MPRHSLVVVAGVAMIAAACARREGPPATPEQRAAHRAAIAAAATDRRLLQYLVKDAEVVNTRLASLRRTTAGFVSGDTNVIWCGFFAGDTLVVLDETRRGPTGVEENARYIYRDTVLHYVALDRSEATASGVPRRLRLAFGYDSVGTLLATSKNVNDAAVPLDTVTDITRIVDRARALRARVLRTNTR